MQAVRLPMKKGLVRRQRSCQHSPVKQILRHRENDRHWDTTRPSGAVHSLASQKVCGNRGADDGDDNDETDVYEDERGGERERERSAVRHKALQQTRLIRAHRPRKLL